MTTYTVSKIKLTPTGHDVEWTVGLQDQQQMMSLFTTQCDYVDMPHAESEKYDYDLTIGFRTKRFVTVPLDEVSMLLVSKHW